MLPFGVTIPATVPQGSEIPEGLMNNPVYIYTYTYPMSGHGLLIIEALRLHTNRHTTLSRTPLDEWSVLRRNLSMTTHNTHNRQTSIPPVGFKSTTPASKRPQTHALDRPATGIGIFCMFLFYEISDLIAFYNYFYIHWSVNAMAIALGVKNHCKVITLHSS